MRGRASGQQQQQLMTSVMCFLMEKYQKKSALGKTPTTFANFKIYPRGLSLS
jgi:hypothetical protein